VCRECAPEKKRIGGKESTSGVLWKGEESEKRREGAVGALGLKTLAPRLEGKKTSTLLETPLTTLWKSLSTHIRERIPEKSGEKDSRSTRNLQSEIKNCPSTKCDPIKRERRPRGE